MRDSRNKLRSEVTRVTGVVLTLLFLVPHQKYPYTVRCIHVDGFQLFMTLQPEFRRYKFEFLTGSTSMIRWRPSGPQMRPNSLVLISN